jgi:hypothetical protein
LRLSEPVGAVPVRLRVTKPGHVSGIVEILPDRDRSVLVTLAQRRQRAVPEVPPAQQAQRSEESEMRRGVLPDPFAR